MDQGFYEFLSNIYTTIDGVVLEKDIDNSRLYISCGDFNDTIEVSYKDEGMYILNSIFYHKECLCTDFSICIDNFINDILESYNSSFKRVSVQNEELCDDEIDEGVSNSKPDFVRLNIDRITSDLSVVVISKLVYEDNLIGYRFRLNNGCLDISLEKGRDLGIVPYKIGKRVPLTAINGVLASKYECSHKVLFPDISNDDELCRRLLEVVLS